MIINDIEITILKTEMFLGLPLHIIESYYIPKLKIEDNICISSKVRDDVNNWLLLTFGSTKIPVLPDGKAIFVNGSFFVNECDYDTFTDLSEK